MPDPLDPRFTQPIEPTMPGQGFGTPPARMTPEEMENSVRFLLNDIFRAGLPNTDPLRINMTPDDITRHGETLEAWAFYEPDLFNGIWGELRTQYGTDPTIAGDVAVDAGIAALMNEILSTAEQRSEIIRTDAEGVTFVTSEGVTEHEGETTVDRTRFVEMPPAEEIMDEFMAGMTAFIGAARAAGEITRGAAAFFLDDPSILYTEYITDLNARMEAGEDIWRAVGADGTPMFLGEREAGTEEIESAGIDRERILREVTSNEREQISEEVIRDLTSTGTVETTEQRQQVDAEIDRRLAERTQTLINEAIQFFGTSTTITTEQVFSRPELTSVLKISPKTFLSAQFSAHALENLAAGNRGAEQARRQTAQGTNVSAPRRIGGV